MAARIRILALRIAIDSIKKVIILLTIRNAFEMFMFAKTRLALLVGWVTGGVAFPLLAQETTKNETIVVTSQMQSGATKLPPRI